ncbi:excinuclease ABC subunit UvrA [[Mycoplasma] mobile]|uniref:UvrABC system protein A n=1 Tax=Mycoplasma mobile (strain ATCC 43663 / 163K / NCTC 11711) TaxID=267748 RepID=Q6KIA9_MYCM1|nr:excinuclease ABC subunit UvrA [[Mycoplasma] mobile]AAT27667.1 excinuclease ABC subunit A [Mycoplasma mobile 163K]
MNQKIDTHNFISIKGAKENNLKNIDVVIPKNKLVVFTGLSGSGKSSLAFNTIYEEGRRRYVDSLGSYARQFLGGTKKPDVHSIDGLSPAISIEQKTTHNNPRSTVGTVTEIHDYLRLLYARIGHPFCSNHKIKITSQKLKDILNTVFSYEKDSKILILAPVISGAKGTHQVLLEKLKKDFLRLKIDGEIYSLDEEINLDKSKKHDIEIVVDRLILNEENRSRIADGIEIALEYSKGLVNVEILGKEKKMFSQLFSCPYGDFEMPKIETKLFSFNSPYGMCEVCKGIGVSLKSDPDLLIPDKTKSILQGAIIPFQNTVETSNLDWQEFKALLDYYEISAAKPIEKMTKSELDIIYYGSKEDINYTNVSVSGNKYTRFNKIEGILTKMERRFLETTSEQLRTWYLKFMSEIQCSKCKGDRLNDYALAVQIEGLNISDFSKLSIEEGLSKILSLEISSFEKEVSTLIVNEIVNRLTFLSDVGLEYLTLNRTAETLSGGEAQRIRLATQIGSNLTGVLYVLDEPSIGLHQKDNEKLIKTLKHMVEIGNTLIVVEHDDETILEADYILDIGPKAGNEGGQIVAQGSVEDIKKSKESITGKYLSGELKIEIPTFRRSGSGEIIRVIGAKENNLKNIDVKFPIGKFIAVTGVSGSGKSTLVNEVLIKGIEFVKGSQVHPGKHKEIKGLHNIDKIIQISQSPIGRTPRSNPATYTTVFDDIRDLFANTEDARASGFLKGRFSFNVNGGRCDKCSGDGYLKIEMHFLPDVYVVCDHCDGKRYNPETLEIKYKFKNISDVLDMTVSEAFDFFANRAKIREKLETLMDVGLGYIKLGQPATTLSGGEAQRVKLATHLLKKSTGKTLYVLDEPTTGLHSYDVSNLLEVLKRIVNKGDTVIVIEHNLDVIKSVDYIIDLGPGGGTNGGKIVATGTPEQVAEIKESFTGQYLKRMLKNAIK